MTKTTKLVWRLSSRPTVEEITLLLKEKILTKDEVKQILFSSETEEDRDKKSLELEIKFLKEIITEMSKTKGQIIDVVKYIEKPIYYNQPWYNGTVTYLCGSIPITGGNTIN